MKVFSVNFKKTVRFHRLVINKSNLIPKLLIEVFCKSINKSGIFFVKYVPAALFHNRHLIAVRLVTVEGTDAFDNMITMRCLDNSANLVRSKIKCRLLKGRVKTSLDKGVRGITVLAVLGNQTCKLVAVPRSFQRFLRLLKRFLFCLLGIRYPLPVFVQGLRFNQNMLHRDCPRLVVTDFRIDVRYQVTVNLLGKRILLIHFA